MLVIRIELWSARTGKREELGRCYIALKEAPEDPSRGDYDVVVNRRKVLDMPQPWNKKGPKPWRQGEVLNYPRKTLNMWRLVIRALKSCLPEEK